MHAHISLTSHSLDSHTVESEVEVDCTGERKLDHNRIIIHMDRATLRIYGIGTFTSVPHISIRAIAQELGISHVSVWRIVNAEGLYPYKLTSAPELLPSDVEHRMFYVTGLHKCR